MVRLHVQARINPQFVYRNLHDHQGLSILESDHLTCLSFSRPIFRIAPTSDTFSARPWPHQPPNLVVQGSSALVNDTTCMVSFNTKLWSRTSWLPVCYKLCVAAKSSTTFRIQLKSPYNLCLVNTTQQEVGNKTDTGRSSEKSYFELLTLKEGEVYQSLRPTNRGRLMDRAPGLVCCS